MICWSKNLLQHFFRGEMNVDIHNISMQHISEGHMLL